VLIRLRTVVKHEAMAIRSARLRLLAAEGELEAREAILLSGPSERAADRERAHCSLAAGGVCGQGDTGPVLSHENVEMVRDASEAHLREGPDAILAYAHPEIEFVEDPISLGQPTHQIVRARWFWVRRDALEAVGLGE
jgi:hypothetical protein